MAQGSDTSLAGMGAAPRLRPTREFLTVAVSTLALIGLRLIFAPSALAYGALSGSLPFAAILAIVGLGQMLVVQQGGFDLSVPGGVSLAVVISSHVPAGDDAALLPAVALAFGCAIVAGALNGVLIGILAAECDRGDDRDECAAVWRGFCRVWGACPGSPPTCWQGLPGARCSGSAIRSCMRS